MSSKNRRRQRGSLFLVVLIVPQFFVLEYRQSSQDRHPKRVHQAAPPVQSLAWWLTACQKHHRDTPGCPRHPPPLSDRYAGKFWNSAERCLQCPRDIWCRVYRWYLGGMDEIYETSVPLLCLLTRNFSTSSTVLHKKGRVINNNEEVLINSSPYI